MVDDPFQAGFGQEIECRGVNPHPGAAEFYLLGRFLGRDIEDRVSAAGQMVGGLKKEGRLADPRVAADQHQRAGYDAATQHPVKFPDAGDDPGLGLGRHITDRYCPGTLSGRGTVNWLDGRFLDHAVPRTAIGAFAQPFG